MELSKEKVNKINYLVNGFQLAFRGLSSVFIYVFRHSGHVFCEGANNFWHKIIPSWF